MRIIRAIAAGAAVLAGLAIPTPARADAIPVQTFYADSLSPLDTCPHGYTKGTLVWRPAGAFSVIAVDVSGSVVDRPTRTEPSFCRTDGYSTTAMFTAYAGGVAVDSRAVGADDSEVAFTFTLGRNSAGSAAALTRLVVQVCRDPVFTLPPSYCGEAVTYYPNRIGPAS